MNYFRNLLGSILPSLVNSDKQPLVSPTLDKDEALFSFSTRQDSAMNGTSFGNVIIGSTGNQARDDLFLSQIEAGNVPMACRKQATISIIDKGNLLKYEVSSDVLSVGSDADYLRASVNSRTARKICDDLYCMLPTRKISNDIWKSSDLKLTPQPMGANPNMVNTKTLIAHNEKINNQMILPFQLVSGHKKDIVFAKRLVNDNKKLAIYGWHSLSGVAIQGLNSTSHDYAYQDYSQSVRLISRDARLNGEVVDLLEILNSPKYAYLISDEGNYNASTIYR